MTGNYKQCPNCGYYRKRAGLRGVESLPKGSCQSCVGMTAKIETRLRRLQQERDALTPSPTPPAPEESPQTP
jgi:hypothetical protein